MFLLFISVTLTGCMKEDKNDVLNKVTKNIDNSNGYNIDAKMELINNDDSYKYDVTVSYKKKNNYRVSLRNKSNNHEQIILKNKEGVFVLTPNLNKSFKFQSNWPNNNSQSYLLQSILKDIKTDNNYKMKSTKNGYILTSKVNYKNNKKLTHQDVYIDKDYNIKKVKVLDNENNIWIKVDFNNIDLKAKFSDDYFVLEENMDKMTLNEETEEESLEFDEAIYPMYLPDGTYLENEKQVDLENGSRIILTFKGENPFMLVEEKVSKSDDLLVVPTSGDLDIFMDSVAIIGDSSVSWIDNDIEYYLVSSSISTPELISVAKSISSIPLTK